MRLNINQINTIKLQTSIIFGDNVRVYLFGSRVDDNAKGGDIDLFIESDTDINQPVLKSLQLNTQLQCLFGLQKIDIVFHCPNYKRLAIHDNAKINGILL